MMTPVKEDRATELSREVIQALERQSGVHPGFRPTRAKGILLSGVFTPSAEGAALTRAPHLRRSVGVTVRFSEFSGLPAIPDNDPSASPRGIAIRFHLAEHVHTDILAHSFDGFPTRTMEEFLEYMNALNESGRDTPKPTPFEAFLAAHPAAWEFVHAARPMPVSLAKESYFAVNAYNFIDSEGMAQFGRYRVRPEGGSEYFTLQAAAEKPADYLFDEIRETLAKSPAMLHIFVQLAGPGDVVDDSTVRWPADRPEVHFGGIEIQSEIPDNAEAQRHIIYDPIPRVDGIESSADPLLDARASLYLMSGRRRRASGRS
ncbi:MAG: catalase family peroxidase [Bryobacteraceae bacterium]|jgi:catalase